MSRRLQSQLEPPSLASILLHSPKFAWLDTNSPLASSGRPLVLMALPWPLFLALSHTRTLLPGAAVPLLPMCCGGGCSQRGRDAGDGAVGALSPVRSPFSASPSWFAAARLASGSSALLCAPFNSSVSFQATGKGSNQPPPWLGMPPAPSHSLCACRREWEEGVGCCTICSILDPMEAMPMDGCCTVLWQGPSGCQSSGGSSVAVLLLAG